MTDYSTIIIFIDEEPKPIATFVSPVNFELDTRKMVDGKHIIKIISKDPTGKEGLRLIPFEVRNGPSIAVEGIKENTIVDGILPLMINAYGKGNQKKFLITGSETPQSIPSWVWILVIGVGTWLLYYFIANIYLPK
jgi:hypothetical protein